MEFYRRNITIVLFTIFTLGFLAIRCIQAKEVKNDDSATLVFGGDLSFSGSVQYFAQKGKGCDYKKPFDKIRSYFKEADYSIVNLESPFSDPITKPEAFLPGKLALHYAEPRAVEGLKYLGVKAVQLANNHFTDFGRTSVLRTISILHAANISQIGVTIGRRKYINQDPLVVEVKGIKIGFLAYCFIKEGCLDTRSSISIGPAVYTRGIAQTDIHYTLKVKKVDHVIVLAHWGTEYVSIPPQKVYKEAKLLKQFGASLIVGGHSHVRQHSYFRGGYLIQFGLGNLLMEPHSTYARIFLPHKNLTDSGYNEYLKSKNNVWDPSAYGFLLKLKLSKDKILQASLLHLRMFKSGPCLQPTPLRNGWFEICEKNDMFCADLQQLFSADYGTWN